MNTKQLISAGFAITAFAAASIPALGGALLPEFVDRPAFTAMNVAAAGDASILPVVVRSGVPSAPTHAALDR